MSERHLQQSGKSQMVRRPNLEAIKAVKNGWDPTGLAVEIAGESAATLGVQGRKATEALRNYRAARDDERAQFRDKAAYAVWAYFIQRELCGMRNHAGIIRDLRIPDEVLRRAGAAATIRRRTPEK